MKMKEYIENLAAFIVEHPECLDFDVVTSSDDEGNEFNSVNYTPSLMFRDGGEVMPCEDDIEANVVCVN